jgi:hypothetical protein
LGDELDRALRVVLGTADEGGPVARFLDDDAADLAQQRRLVLDASKARLLPLSVRSARLVRSVLPAWNHDRS